MRNLVTSCLVCSVLTQVSTLKAGDGDNERLGRLEALLEAQQQRIQSLQQQLAGPAQDQDAARVDAMKQQIREVLSESEFRESLMPSVVMAGYDNGFYIHSSDDNFSLAINGLLQFRFTHYGTRDRNRYLAPRLRRNDRTGFDVERLRLDFSGHAYSPDWTYLIELEADAADGYDFVLGEGWVNYRFADAFNMKAGLFTGKASRAST